MVNFYDLNVYLIFIIGLCLGSFLNVVIYRLPRELTISKGRSMCPNCEYSLKWYDLVPLFSYLFLRGRCRKCKNKISPQYPLVEFFTGILFVITYSIFTINVTTFEWFHYIALFIILTVLLFVVVGVFTDFLYHGVFDFSTIVVVILFCIYIAIVTQSFVIPLQVAIQSLSYLLPIIFIVLYLTFKLKGKWILCILSFMSLLAIAVYSMLFVSFDFNTTLYIGASVINWFTIFIFILLADIVLQRVITSKRIKHMVSHILTWLNFVLYFIFTLNPTSEILTKKAFVDTLTFNLKNVIIVLLFTGFYLFMLELFATHDNSEDVIDNDEEIIERNENLFTALIGDGDLLILPLVGLLLGYGQIFNFYILLGVSVLSIYTLIFKKGFTYSVPLYPFIILNIFTIYFI